MGCFEELVHIELLNTIAWRILYIATRYMTHAALMTQNNYDVFPIQVSTSISKLNI